MLLIAQSEMVRKIVGGEIIRLIRLSGHFNKQMVFLNTKQQLIESSDKGFLWSKELDNDYSIEFSWRATSGSNARGPVVVKNEDWNICSLQEQFLRLF